MIILILIMQCSAVQYSAVQCISLQFSAVQYIAVQHSAELLMQCNAIHASVKHCSEDYFGIGATFRTPRETQFLPYAGFSSTNKQNYYANMYSCLDIREYCDQLLSLFQAPLMALEHIVISYQTFFLTIQTQGDGVTKSSNKPLLGNRELCPICNHASLLYQTISYWSLQSKTD